MRARRKFDCEFKRKVVEEVRSGVLSVAQAMRQYELASNLVYRWMDQYDHGKLNNEPTAQGALENKIAELERKVGQQAMEIEFLKKARDVYRTKLSGQLSGPIQRAASCGGAK
jgi:transposase-like protein